MIRKRINILRESMKEYNMDVYLIPTSDYHMSEYVCEHFKTREYYSGFTGSAGTLVVSVDEAYLFTDGRYFIQAEKEISESGIILMKMGEEGVPSLEEFIDELLPDKGTVGFDARVVSGRFGEKIEKIANSKRAIIISDKDVAGELWDLRPGLEFADMFYLEEKYSGKPFEEKLNEVRKIMKEKGANAHVISSLDDQAWLFNLRGRDIPYNPVFFAFTLITEEEVVIYTGAKVPENLQGAIHKDYYNVYADLEKISGRVLLDKESINYRIIGCLKNAEIIDDSNPTLLLKAIKNATEISNLKKCHVKDGVAVTKFMYWLKNNVGKIYMDEYTASEYIDTLRGNIEGFSSLSFNTISAYNANAAMMHYNADKDNCAKLEAKGMLLVDSGGQYYEGTTDITRTYILGDISDEMKKHYTLVVKSMLNLAEAKFLYGCTGINLDILARGPLWDIGLDYKCGTGHGVGYMLNVHEGPNGFRWRRVPERNDNGVLQAGMVTTDEPGVYVEGSHGIRIENELVCVERETNEYGKFMGFETITLAPIDLDGIDVRWLDDRDRERLNNYHQKVYDSLVPYMNKEEARWLEKYTRRI